jgi:short subunit dehydrogenase-like uncharacterized protein
VFLYGATGYSGRLIAAEARRRLDSGQPYEVVLGGRDRQALAEMHSALNLEFVVLALDDQRQVESLIRSFDFDVIINAAGPFARTGVRLAKAALATGRSYVDINGEVDVYKAMDDLDPIARDRKVTLVSGAGFTATASDVLVSLALKQLSTRGELLAGRNELGVIRIAMSAIQQFSRGSLETMLRSVREEVVTARHGKLVHVPIGRLERTFDFGHSSDRLRIASAVNTIDTLTALRTGVRQGFDVGLIESYVEMSEPVRFAYQLGAWSAVWLQLPLVQRLNRLQIAQFPDGPDEDERRNNRHTVLLQIETPLREVCIDWRLETDDSYAFTSRSVLAVATSPNLTLRYGWRTPADVLTEAPLAPAGIASLDPFTNCSFQDRTR